MTEKKACNICVECCYCDVIEHNKEDVCFCLRPEDPQMIIKENLCNGCGGCVVGCLLNCVLSSDTIGGKGPPEDYIALKVENGTVARKHMEGCITCIVCNGKPACIDDVTQDRENFSQLFLSSLYYIKFKLSSILRKLS